MLATWHEGIPLVINRAGHKGGEDVEVTCWDVGIVRCGKEEGVLAVRCPPLSTDRREEGAGGAQEVGDWVVGQLSI